MLCERVSVWSRSHTKNLDNGVERQRGALQAPNLTHQGSGTNSDTRHNNALVPCHGYLSIFSWIVLHSLRRLRPALFGFGKRPVPNNLHFFVGFAYTS